MKANDTVLSIAELVEVRFKYNHLKAALTLGEAKELRWDRYLAKAQAENTWGKALKEVVEWFEIHFINEDGSPYPEEWGMETEGK